MTGRTPPRSGNADVSEVSRYDLVLLLVLTPLLAGEILWLPSQAGLVAGGVLSALVVAHLLFLDPPTKRGPRSRRDSRGPTTGRSA